MKSDIAVKVTNVKKDFHLPRHGSNSIKTSIVNTFKSKDKSVDVHHALKDISFEIKKGEFFGILGRNGSGKSTLLKIISEIYRPTAGTVKHSGSLVSFIELGVGFKPELSGRENIYLNGALLGFSKSEIDELYDEIVAFAELEEFMEQKIKNYSSGMKVRLAFAVAIQAKSDILVLDEVLAVGDASFQKKCYDYFKTLKQDRSKTIVFVTHSMGAVKNYCDRAILIDDGYIIHEGDAEAVANEYLELFRDSKKNTNNKNIVTNETISDVEFQGASIYQENEKVEIVQFKKDFSLELKFFAGKDHEDVTMGIHFFDKAGRDIIAISSRVFGKMNLKKGLNRVVVDVQNILSDGDYYVNCAIEDSYSKKLLVQQHKITPFSVKGLDATGYSKHSLVHPEVEVRLE